MLRVFIGYDASETVAYHVLAHSILRRSKSPVCVTPLVLGQLPMTRERDPKQSTDFAFSRFLVPYLCEFKGCAVFMDCDMIVRCDLNDILQAADPVRAVSVVKHDYTPLGETKFLDHKQTAYPRKNWSSVMVFNNAKCTALTPQYVNSASGLELHRFSWINDGEIGELPREWNHLVGEYPPNPEAKIVHFTLGTPCFGKYRRCEYAHEWNEERGLMLDYERRGEYQVIREVQYG